MMAVSRQEARKPTPLDLHVGRRIEIARKARHLTLRNLANAMPEVTHQAIQKWEAGGRISAGRLWQIAQATRRPITFFFDGISAEAPPQSQPTSEALPRKESHQQPRQE